MEVEMPAGRRNQKTMGLSTVAKPHNHQDAVTSFQTKDRFLAIDGLRGIAILLVLGFHFCYVYSPSLSGEHFYPFGDAFTGVPLFKFGFMGVQLFFLISGFVIAFTLERCSSPLDFAKRRFARIWPALFVCSIATFCLLSISNSSFAQMRQVSWIDFLPSLTLTPVELWRPLFPGIHHMDGPYWTLVVETQFYFLAALLYWAIPVSTLATRLTTFAVLDFALRAALQIAAPALSNSYSLILIPEHMPWFAAGAAFYEFFSGKIRGLRFYVLQIICFLIIAKIAFRNPSPIWIIGISGTFFGIFLMLSQRNALAKILEGKAIVWIGLSSYSIYLLHQSFGLILIGFLPERCTAITYLAFLTMISGILIVAGFASYRLVERHGRDLVMHLTARLFLK